MKAFILLTLITSQTYAAIPLNFKAGYWEYKADLSQNPMMDMAMKSLKHLPKAQREAMYKKMGMNGDLKTTYNCFTKEDMKNFEKKLSGQTMKQGCKLKIVKSTKTIFQANIKCEDSKYSSKIYTKMKSSKEGMMTLNMDASPGAIKVNMKWIKESCTKKKS